MTEDRETVDPAVGGAAGEVRSQAPATEPQTGRQPWRPTVFLVLTIVFLGLGIWFKQLAA